METKTYKYPRGRKELMLVGLVLFGFLGGFMLFKSDELWLIVAVWGLGMIIFLWQAGGSLVTFTVDSQGIRKSWPWGGERGINWMNITQARPNWLNNGLTLSDHMGMEKISLDPNVAAYPQLLDDIRLARPGLWGEYEGQRFSLQNWVNVLFGALIAIAMLALFVFMLEEIPSFVIIFAAVLLVIPFLSYAIRPWQIWKEGLDLHIRYLWGTKRASALSIQVIEMQIIHGSRGRKNTYLMLIYKDGKTTRLPGDARSASLAYIVLRSWLQRNAAGNLVV